jgi:phospholipid/cholesterol/gamma-HCH transport system substrate-binding protein
MKRRDEVIVGIFTIVAVALLVASMLWLARGGLSRGYPIYSTFAWGEGLKQGQPVLFSGANVGYVDDIELLDTGLVVVMRISKGTRIPDGSAASIAPYGFFGDKLIALKPTRPPSGQYLESGDTIPSMPGGIQIAELLNRVDTISQGLTALVASLQEELIGQRAIRTVRLTVQRADSLFQVIARLAAHQSAELTKTQETLRNAITSVDSARLRPLVDEIRATTQRANAFIDEFGRTNARVNGILARLEAGEGTAGKLLTDSTLERDLRATITRLDSLMADFMANPRKYIRLSIF